MKRNYVLFVSKGSWFGSRNFLIIPSISISWTYSIFVVAVGWGTLAAGVASYRLDRL